MGPAVGQFANAVNVAQDQPVAMSSVTAADPQVATDGAYGTAFLDGECAQTLPEYGASWLRVDLGEEVDVSRIGLWGRSDARPGFIAEKVEVRVGNGEDWKAADLCSSMSGEKEVTLNPGFDSATNIAICNTVGTAVFVVSKSSTDRKARALAVCEVVVEPRSYTDRLMQAPGPEYMSSGFVDDLQYGPCTNNEDCGAITLIAEPTGVVSIYDEVAILPPGASCGDAGFAEGFGVNPFPGVSFDGVKLDFPGVAYDEEGLMTLAVGIGRPMVVKPGEYVICACLAPIVPFNPRPFSECTEPKHFTSPAGSLIVEGPSALDLLSSAAILGALFTVM
jgi:hypothetical protein